MQHNPKQTTLIIGGGIVGATLALKLAKGQRPVTLIDAHLHLTASDWDKKISQRDARVFALSLASIELLNKSVRGKKLHNPPSKADY